MLITKTTQIEVLEISFIQFYFIDDQYTISFHFNLLYLPSGLLLSEPSCALHLLFLSPSMYPRSHKLTGISYFCGRK